MRLFLTPMSKAYILVGFTVGMHSGFEHNSKIKQLWDCYFSHYYTGNWLTNENVDVR